jgi:uncharacterized membrane protein
MEQMPTKAPGLLMGLGFGGFVDGIVLHEILQWHHMISNAEPTDTLAGLELNVVADGFFHVGTWLLVMAGTILTVRSWRQGRLAPNWSFHLGLLLLGVHHVRDDLCGPRSWDIGFLVFGVVQIVVGWLIHRRGARSLSQSVQRTRSVL